jgi:hypothetical protein
MQSHKHVNALTLYILIFRMSPEISQSITTIQQAKILLQRIKAQLMEH